SRSRELQQEQERYRQELWESLQETERARAEAEAANQAKDRFLAVLSHELRTPLMPVVMSVRMLEKNPDLPPAARDAIAVIQRNVQLEIQLTSDLLDVTRISQGKLELRLQPLDLHDVLQQALEIALPDLQARSQQLDHSLDASRHHLTGDPIRLKQV